MAGLLAGLVAREVGRAAREAVLRHTSQGVGAALPAIEREVLAAIGGVLGGEGVAPQGAGPTLPGPVLTPYLAGPSAGPSPRVVPPRATSEAHGAPGAIVPIIPPKEAAKLRKGAGRRPPEAIARLEQAVLQVVHSEPGLRAVEVAARVGVGANDLRDVLINLKQAGKLRTEGVKHGTRYFPPKGAKAAQKPASA